MDGHQFDTLARTLGSRRLVLGGLFGGSLGALLELVTPNEASARNRVPFCKTLADPEQRRLCLKRARAHNRRCHSRAARLKTCDQRCGPVRNGCGKLIECTCPAGETCLSNGSCAQVCLFNSDCSNAQNCTCTQSAGADKFCLADINECVLSLQECERPTDCPVGHACRSVFCGSDVQNFVHGCVPICGI